MTKIWPGIGFLTKAVDTISEQQKVIRWQAKRIENLHKLLEEAKK